MLGRCLQGLLLGALAAGWFFAVLFDGEREVLRREAPFAELWRDGRWSRAGELRHPREEHQALRLSDGSVLVFGGHDREGDPVAMSERWADGSFREAGALDGEPRAWAPLTGGRALVVTGERWWLFSPGGWSSQPPAAENVEWLVPLDDGALLVVGANSAGLWKDGKLAPPAAREPLELFAAIPDGKGALLLGRDGGAQRWESGTVTAVTGLGQFLARDGLNLTHAFRLPDGRVLLLGFAGAYLWEPRDGVSRLPRPASLRANWPAAAALDDGRVLCTGSAVFGTRVADLFDGRAFSPTGTMALDRVRHTLTALGDGRALAAGGASTSVSLAMLTPYVMALVAAGLLLALWSLRRETGRARLAFAVGLALPLFAGGGFYFVLVAAGQAIKG